MDGVGTFTWTDGTQYVGIWKRGKHNHKCVKGYLNVNLPNVSEMDELNLSGLATTEESECGEDFSDREDEESDEDANEK